jgi:uncharacterized protein (DUF427 family)
MLKTDARPAVDLSNHDRYKPISPDHSITTEPVSHKSTYKINVNGADVELASSVKAVVLREANYGDVYYINPSDVNFKVLVKSNTVSYCPFKGYATYYSVVDGPEDVAWVYETPYDQVSLIKGHLSFYQNKVIKV